MCSEVKRRGGEKKNLPTAVPKRSISQGRFKLFFLFFPICRYQLQWRWRFGCIAQHEDVIKGPNFQIMFSSHPVDRNRGCMGRHAGRLILICNPNWRLTNSFDLPLEARARSAKKPVPHNHLLLR